MANNLWVGAFRKALAADKPTVPDFPSDTFGFFYETDTGKLNFGVSGGTEWLLLTPPSGSTAPSTSATVAASGVSVHSSTGAQAFTLAAPFFGADKTIVLNSTSTSTLARTFTLASGNLASTASSTYTVITFNGPGQSVRLVGLSTSKFQVTANNGATLS